MEVGQFYSSVKLYVYICTYWLRRTGYVTVMTPIHCSDNQYMLLFFYMEDKNAEKHYFQSSSL